MKALSIRQPWFFGPYGFVLAEVAAFGEPIPWRGELGFFEVPAALTLEKEQVECSP